MRDMKTVLPAWLPLLLLACAFPAACADQEATDENALIRAQVFVDQGDLKRGLVSLVRILRESKNEDLRNSARDELESLGFNAQEIFKLDPANAKPEEFDALADRVAEFQAHKRRLTLDHEYATQVLRDALIVRIDLNELKADMRIKDAARAVAIFIDLALDEKGGDIARESQHFLENAGIAGAKIEEVKKAAAEGKLPDDALKNVKAASLFMRLDEYRGWRENVDLDEDALLKQKLAREYGLLIFAYLKKNYGNDTIFQRNEELAQYWNAIKPDEKPKTALPAEKTEPAKKTDEKDLKF